MVGPNRRPAARSWQEVCLAVRLAEGVNKIWVTEVNGQWLAVRRALPVDLPSLVMSVERTAPRIHPDVGRRRLDYGVWRCSALRTHVARPKQGQSDQHETQTERDFRLADSVQAGALFFSREGHGNDGTASIEINQMDLATHQHSILEQARGVDVEGQCHEIFVQRDTSWCICHTGQWTFDEDGIREDACPLL